MFESWQLAAQRGDGVEIRVSQEAAADAGRRAHQSKEAKTHSSARLKQATREPSLVPSPAKECHCIPLACYLCVT